MDDTERAHDIIEEHADADMGADEMLNLLLENDVPEALAYAVVADVCG